jgi:hypothetical protein
MEKVKFNFDGGLQNVAKIGLAGWLSFQTLSSLRVEAQSFNESETGYFSSQIQNSCILTAEHASADFKSKKLLQNQLIYDPKKDDIFSADQIVGHNPEIRYLKEQDGAIICKSIKDYWKFVNGKNKPLATREQFIRGIKKNPLATVNSYVFPVLLGKDQKGKEIEITPYTPESVFRKVRKAKQALYGTPVREVVKTQICYLNFTYKDFDKKDKNIPYRDTQLALAKPSKYYNNKFSNLPVINPLVKGRSGSPVLTFGFRSFGAFSTFFDAGQKDKNKVIREIKNTQGGKKSIALCEQKGFKSNDSQIIGVAVFHRNSELIIKPNGSGDLK